MSNVTPINDTINFDSGITQKVPAKKYHIHFPEEDIFYVQVKVFRCALTKQEVLSRLKRSFNYTEHEAHRLYNEAVFVEPLNWESVFHGNFTD